MKFSGSSRSGAPFRYAKNWGKKAGGLMVSRRNKNKLRPRCKGKQRLRMAAHSARMAKRKEAA